jgi:hypothetical protein
MVGKALSGYLVFVTLAGAVALVVALAGHLVALERWGAEAASAWRLGCGICLLASLVSGLLLALSGRLKMSGVTVALGSMLGLVGSAVAVAFSIELRPFLLAVAASYLALLIVDTGYALFVSGASLDSPSDGVPDRL